MDECDALSLVAGVTCSGLIGLIEPPTRTPDATSFVSSDCLLSVIHEYEITGAGVATLDYEFCNCLRGSPADSTRQSSISATCICFVQFDCGCACNFSNDIRDARKLNDVAHDDGICCILRNSGVTIGDRYVIREGCGINFSKNCHCTPCRRCSYKLFIAILLSETGVIQLRQLLCRPVCCPW